MHVAATSEVGYARARNEDAHLTAPARNLFAIADGMGGHPAGDVASKLALAAVDERLTADALEASTDRLELLRESLTAAHERVIAAARDNRDLRGMGTTAVVTHLDEAAGLLTVAHVGDSRAYLLAGDHGLRRITHDHVASQHFGRTLTQAIGTSSDLEPEAAEVKVPAGARVMLCTDGLTDLVPEDEIEELLGRDAPVDAVCDGLVDAALAHGGHDNVTVLVFDTETS